MDRLKFITNENLIHHIGETIKQYGVKLQSYDLKKFNSNIIDPIKLIFDKMVYKATWDEIIKNEIFRQRDKSTTNDIGYFHQNIFKYIKYCEVPDAGWDVIYTPPAPVEISKGTLVSKIYVEMKNKHNTMNSTSSQGTYIRCLDKLAKEKDCACFLVEAIAKKSQNIEWKTTIDKEKISNGLLRRVSIDEFYKIVTGDELAFYKLCMVLPEIITEVLDKGEVKTPDDTAVKELMALTKDEKDVNMAIMLSLYMLGFKSYLGFTK